MDIMIITADEGLEGFMPLAEKAHEKALEDRVNLGLGLPDRYKIRLVTRDDETAGTASHTMLGGKKDIGLYFQPSRDVSDKDLLSHTIEHLGHELDHAHLYDSIAWRHIHAAHIWARSHVQKLIDGKESTLEFPMSAIVKQAKFMALARPLLEARAYITTGVIKGHDLFDLAEAARLNIQEEYIEKGYVKSMKDSTAVQLVISGDFSASDVAALRKGTLAPDRAEFLQRIVEEETKPLYELGADSAVQAVCTAFSEDVSRFERAQDANSFIEYCKICIRAKE